MHANWARLWWKWWLELIELMLNNHTSWFRYSQVQYKTTRKIEYKTKKTQNIEAFPLGNRFYYYYGIDTNFPWSMKLIHWMSLSFPLNTEPIYRYYLLYKRIKKASGLVVYVWSLCVHAITKGVTQHTHIFKSNVNKYSLRLQCTSESWM